MDSPPHPPDRSSGLVTPTVEKASPAFGNYSLLVAKCLFECQRVIWVGGYSVIANIGISLNGLWQGSAGDRPYADQ